MKRYSFRYRLAAALVFAAVVFVVPVYAQDIITASVFYDRVSENYRQIEDYRASVVIRQEGSVMRGTLYHKRPNYLLIEFTEPKDQVISVDGTQLVIYIPSLNVAMEQQLRKRREPAVSLATGPGLELMKSRYSIAYLDSQDLVPLEAGSGEMVRKLKLEWRSIDEGFRQLTLSISEAMFIRRIVGITAGYEEVQLDFMDIVTNQGIPDGRFRYDSPPTASVIRNFIFPPEE